MSPEVFNLSAFLTLIAMVGASFVFIYQEIQSLKKDLKEDFGDIRASRKAEIDQVKSDVLIFISDLKQTFKNDLNGSKQDLKQDVIDLKTEAKKDMKDIQREMLSITEKVARIEGTLLANQKPNPPA